MNEQWKDVAGFEGRYSISSAGRVYSHINQKCLKPILTKYGYYRVHLAQGNGAIATVAVHRLVAGAFIPNPENKPTVNHINEIKTDNRIDNLEWATSYEQNVHGTRIQRVREHTDYKARKIDYSVVAAKHDYFNMNKDQMKPVLQFDENGTFVARFAGLTQAARAIGRSAGSLRRCLKGERRTCGGYQWKYA